MPTKSVFDQLPRDTRELYRSQMEFVRANRKLVPRLITITAEATGFSPSMVSQVLTGKAFNSIIVSFLYSTVIAELGGLDPEYSSLDDATRPPQERLDEYQATHLMFDYKKSKLRFDAQVKAIQEQIARLGRFRAEFTEAETALGIFYEAKAHKLSDVLSTEMHELLESKDTPNTRFPQLIEGAPSDDDQGLFALLKAEMEYVHPEHRTPSDFNWLTSPEADDVPITGKD